MRVGVFRRAGQELRPHPGRVGLFVLRGEKMPTIDIGEDKRLREKWGGGPCNHPELAKEYDRGMSTGDYICTTCGESFTLQEARELRQARSKGAAEAADSG